MKRLQLPANWKRQRLAELIVKFDAGVSVNGGDRAAIDGEYGVLKISAVTEGQFRPNENKVIEGLERDRACVNPKRNRLIISRANTPELVGASAYIDRDYPNLFLSDKLWQFEPREEGGVSMRWLGFVLGSTAYRKRMGEIATGSSQSMKNVSQESVMQLELPVPPFKEQQGVAQLLEAWDAAIEKTERLIVLRVRHKAWLLSQVISASGIATKLGDFLRHVSRPVPKPAQAYWALGIRSHGKGTFQRFVEDPSSVDMEELYAVNRDDLIVNITFAWEGAIASVKPEDERCLVSHRFPTYEVDCKKADPVFVKYIVNRKPFFSQLALISPGGAGRNRVLNKKDFLKLTVSLPPLDEQKRLAHVMAAMDLLIENERSLLMAVKTQKRGLMQKLLTGQWRVPVKSDEVGA